VALAFVAATVFRICAAVCFFTTVPTSADFEAFFRKVGCENNLVEFLNHMTKPDSEFQVRTMGVRCSNRWG
jgi:hypothetical protein